PSCSFRRSVGSRDYVANRHIRDAIDQGTLTDGGVGEPDAAEPHGADQPGCAGSVPVKCGSTSPGTRRPIILSPGISATGSAARPGELSASVLQRRSAGAGGHGISGAASAVQRSGCGSSGQRGGGVRSIDGQWGEPARGNGGRA